MNFGSTWEPTAAIRRADLLIKDGNAETYLSLRSSPHRSGKATGLHQRVQLHAVQQVWCSLVLFPPLRSQHRGRDREYSREDKDDPAAENHFWGRCGSTTHFTLTESAISKFGNVRTGVNMSLADESDLAGIELRYPDGRAWSGGADFGYVREPRVIGQSAASQGSASV